MNLSLIHNRKCSQDYMVGRKALEANGNRADIPNTMADTCICSNCQSDRPEAPGPCPNCGDTGRTFGVTATATVTATASCEATVRRGEKSWAYINFVTAFLFGVTSTVIAVLDVPGWAKAIGILVAAVILVVAVATNGRLQNLLLGIKQGYEDKFR